MSQTPTGDDVSVRVERRRASADEWALVLVAEGLHPRVLAGRDGFDVRVPAAEAARAHASLDDYEREAPAPAPAPPPDMDPHAVRNAAAVAGLLIAFFLVTGERRSGIPWFDAGSSDAARVLAGEAWRTVTALTLHADFGHVLSNAAAGTLFGSALTRALGPGLALALAVAAGAVGNLGNAWLHGARHDSVGASTAVFAVVGALGGLAIVRPRSRSRFGPWVPVAATLALLAMLGTQGERVDLWAHGWGLAVGLGFGWALATFAPLPLGPRAQRWLAAAAIAAVALSWTLALRAPAP